MGKLCSSVLYLVVRAFIWSLKSGTRESLMVGTVEWSMEAWVVGMGVLRSWMKGERVSCRRRMIRVVEADRMDELSSCMWRTVDVERMWDRRWRQAWRMELCAFVEEMWSRNHWRKEVRVRRWCVVRPLEGILGLEMSGRRSMRWKAVKVETS